MNFPTTEETGKDLEKIWLYTFENWSIEQAEKYLNLFLTRLNISAQNQILGLITEI